MQRLLAVSLAVSAVVLVALGLLVHRALQSVEVERAARHRTVADRAVDEMERELGIPIYDSVATVVWKALKITGVDPREVKGWGGLFA